MLQCGKEKQGAEQYVKFATMCKKKGQKGYAWSCKCPQKRLVIVTAGGGGTERLGAERDQTLLNPTLYFVNFESSECTSH